MAVEDVVDGALVVELVAEGLAERVLEVTHGRVCRDVEQGLRHRGDWNASKLGGVSGIEGACAADADPGTLVLDAGAVTSGRGAS